MIVIETIVRVLAIVGAFALGAAVTGWLMNKIAGRYYKDHKLPPWASWLSRTLGGALLAFVAYLATFGGGGAGLGGTGGWFGGSYPSRPTADSGKELPKEKDKDKDKEKKTEPPSVIGGDTVRIEVLGDAPLEKLGGGKFDRERRYQVKGVSGVLTLDEVKKHLTAMRQGKPGLRRVEVVLYYDSPNRDRPQVAELVAYVKDLSGAIPLDFYEPGRRAPVD